jgi:hypothetical protein
LFKTAATRLPLLDVVMVDSQFMRLHFAKIPQSLWYQDSTMKSTSFRLDGRIHRVVSALATITENALPY